jgi:hypothetical protein
MAMFFWSAALTLAWLLGAYDGRERERRRISAGQVTRWEMELLRSQGNRVHPNPAAAARSSRVRIVR